MSQRLPVGGFKWVQKVDNPDFWNVPDDNDKGYMLEVDLHCPPEVHNKLSDLHRVRSTEFPQAPNRKSF